MLTLSPAGLGYVCVLAGCVCVCALYFLVGWVDSYHTCVYLLSLSF